MRNYIYLATGYTERKGWRKLVLSHGHKQELMTAAESFCLILQLSKVQLSLERPLLSLAEAVTQSSQCPLLVAWRFLSAWPRLSFLPPAGVVSRHGGKVWRCFPSQELVVQRWP